MLLRLCFLRSWVNLSFQWFMKKRSIEETSALLKHGFYCNNVRASPFLFLKTNNWSKFVKVFKRRIDLRTFFVGWEKVCEFHLKFVVTFSHSITRFARNAFSICIFCLMCDVRIDVANMWHPFSCAHFVVFTFYFNGFELNKINTHEWPHFAFLFTQLSI